MDRFEEEEMKKTRPIEDTWYDWLINYIPKPIRRSVSVLKDNLQIFLRQAHLYKVENCLWQRKDTQETKKTIY